MKILVLGAGMMGRAIVYDLSKYSNFKDITIADKDKKTIQSAKKFLGDKNLKFININVENTNLVKNYFQNFDVAISAVPYRFNYTLARIAVETITHFLDLGGNNEIVEKELDLSKEAMKNGVTIIPDCGLAPGLTSIITRDIVEQMESVDYVKLRVGGLPVNPKPPLNYQIVFSLTGLLNEYVEDAIVLDRGKIVKKKSMTELETIIFPQPFGKMEAFLTSGGCSTLPYIYKNKIHYLDYKTVRYPGHCDKFKTLLDLGFALEKKIKIGKQEIVPKDLLTTLRMKKLPRNEEDVVLLKVLSEGMKEGKKCRMEYTMMDYYDEENNISAMMRTTGYSVSIIAQMIEKGIIKKKGVFCPGEIVPYTPFFDELNKRDITIKKSVEILEI